MMWWYKLNENIIYLLGCPGLFDLPGDIPADLFYPQNLSLLL